jgi:ABC-type branched-subunit amino acid transport system substrate-binding protein
VRLVDGPAAADAVVYAGEDARAAARALPRRGTVVLPDALARAADALDSGLRRRAVLVSSAPEPGSTPELEAFEAAFREAYGREPGPYAAVGYEGMRRVLAAIERAGAAASRRRRVIDAFFVAPPQPPPFTAFRLRGGAREYLPL